MTLMTLYVDTPYENKKERHTRFPSMLGIGVLSRCHLRHPRQIGALPPHARD